MIAIRAMLISRLLEHKDFRVALALVLLGGAGLVGGPIT
jgi:hypothetical protein